MIGTLAQHEVGARTRRQDVLAQVHQVDGVPNPRGRLARLLVGERRIAVEIGFGIAET